MWTGLRTDSAEGLVLKREIEDGIRHHLLWEEAKSFWKISYFIQIFGTGASAHD